MIVQRKLEIMKNSRTHSELAQEFFRRLAGKKISAATFTPDSKHVIFADKSGDVYSSELYMDSANQNESGSTCH